MRFDFLTEAGRQIGVLTHHGGRRELMVYDRSDPDACREVISFTDDEADTLASLLGAARITGPLNDLQQRIDGLAIDWIAIEPQSPFAGRPMGDTQARTKTGVSIVAVVRGDEPFPSPKPDFPFEGGDLIVVAGTPDGIKALRSILAG